MAGETHALLTGGTQAAVKSVGRAELHGGFAAYVTSPGKVVVEAGSSGFFLESIGTATLHMRSDLSVISADAKVKTSRLEIESSDLKATTKGNIDLLAMKNAVIEADDGSVLVSAANHVTELSLKKANLSLTHDGWGIFAQKERICIGQNISNNDVFLTKGEISLNKKTSWVKVTENYAQLKGKSNYVKCDATNVTIKGKRIDLD